MVTAQRILDAEPSVVRVVPLTTTIRGFGSEVNTEPDAVNLLERPCAVQSQHIRPVSTGRIENVVGSAGAVALAQVRDVIGLILDIP